MKKTDNTFKSGFPKKKNQFEISREDLARAMDHFKNAGGKITLIERPTKDLDNISYKTD